uniref:Uncharacterized protein n=1 Tax=Romanomermis culicivorax TaxID=13658 RepID=A0A915IVM1_ROMCU
MVQVTGRSNISMNGAFHKKIGGNMRGICRVLKCRSYVDALPMTIVLLRSCPLGLIPEMPATEKVPEFDGESWWCPSKMCYFEADAALPIWFWCSFFEINGLSHIFTVLMAVMKKKALENLKFDCGIMELSILIVDWRMEELWLTTI